MKSSMSYILAAALLPSMIAWAQQAAKSDTWTFEPRDDTFGAECLLDLRGLNEKSAGESGWMVAREGKLYIPGHKASVKQ